MKIQTNQCLEMDVPEVCWSHRFHLFVASLNVSRLRGACWLCKATWVALLSIFVTKRLLLSRWLTSKISVPFFVKCVFLHGQYSSFDHELLSQVFILWKTSKWPGLSCPLFWNAFHFESRKAESKKVFNLPFRRNPFFGEFPSDYVQGSFSEPKETWLILATNRGNCLEFCAPISSKNNFCSFWFQNSWVLMRYSSSFFTLSLMIRGSILHASRWVNAWTFR